MSDATRDADRPGHEERCPFCHDAIVADAALPDERRVLCDACQAPHHAACFVEHAGCSATGCRSPHARTGSDAEPVPVGVLSAQLRTGRVSGTVPSRRGSFAAWLFFCFLGATFTALALSLGATWLGTLLAVTFSGLAVVWLLAALLAPPAPRIHVEPAEAPDPILPDGGLAGTFPGVFESADPYEPIRRRIASEEGAPRPDAAAAPGAPAPTRCAACGNSVEREAGDEAGEPLRFCFHCGASLA